ncbi:MAG: PQQ-binding-like beta-propeller repeat protein [Pirellulales bacterium]
MTTSDRDAHETQPPATPTAGGRRFLCTVGVLAVLGILAVWFLLPERFDLGTRKLISFLIVVLAAVATAVWFFVFARLPRRAKRIGAIALAVVGVAFVVSIRRVEFSGDMTPTFDFRWTADRYAVLEAHRARQQAAQAKTAANEVAPLLEQEIRRPSDWNVLEFRGPRRDGIVTGPKLARDWSSQPPKLVWRQPVGGGYASFVVEGSLVVTLEQRRDKEAIVAYDFDTATERWVYEYPALFSEQLGGDGPRATPTISNGRVFALGATGVLTCVDLATGERRWWLNILKLNRAANLDWGMSGSPLVYDDRVLVNPGTQKGSAESRAIATFEAAGGMPRWASGEATASYCSPMLATLGGVRQVLVFDAAGLAGFDPEGSGQLWRTPWKSDFDINAAQPVVLDGDRVFISSSTGAAVFQIAKTDEGWSVDEVWKTTRMKCGYACPIAYQGYVYGIDENILACVDLADGKRMWKDRQGQFGHGQILLSGDLLIVLGEAGELALVEATPDGYHELGRLQAIEGKTWNNPTLVGNRIFVRNHLEMAAYDLPLAE